MPLLVFFYFLFCAHKNLRISDVIEFISESMSMKMDIVYTGMASSIAFIKISLLTCDKNFSFHPLIFLVILSLM